MSYEHCAVHDRDATNGCLDCVADGVVGTLNSKPELTELTEATAELVDEPTRDPPPEDPPPELIDALVKHYANKRVLLEMQIAQMERLLGFIEISAELSVRVARLEQFLGLKG